MDFERPGWHLIDDFFRAEGDSRSVATARRYVRVRERMMQFLDTADMARGLGTEPATLLDAERQFHPDGAFWLVFGPDELVCCLPLFVQEAWLPEGVMEARTQISLVGRLLHHMAHGGLLVRGDTQCALYEAEDAVRRARQVLDQRPAEPSEHDTRMPDRFRQHPGPQW